MCQFNLHSDDVAKIVKKQNEDLALLSAQILGVHADIFGDGTDKIVATILEQGVEAIVPGLAHAFLIGLQLGQKYPTAVYPGKYSPIEVTHIYDEEEETELTFQSVRNS